MTLFRLAIIERKADNVLSLIQTGAIDVNAPLFVSRQAITTPLVLASESGEPATVNVLLNAGAKIDARDSRGQTACIAAARAKAFAVVELLVARGANLAAVDNEFNYSALDHVTMSDRTADSTCAALVRAGSPLDGVAPLCRVAAQGTNTLQALLDRNVNVAQLRDDFQMTPCHVACENPTLDSPELLSMLVNVAGVDIDAANHSGAACLHACAAFDKRSSLRWLINAGATIDQQSRESATALHEACDSRQYYSALLLIAAGADVHARTDDGQTACHLVIASNYLHLDDADSESSLLALLLAAGADLQALNKNGQTPLQSGINLRMPTADDVEFERRSIAKTRLELVRERAFEVCVGLQALQLDALQTCEILVHACGPAAPMVSFHHWWKIATLCKHFRQL